MTPAIEDVNDCSVCRGVGSDDDDDGEVCFNCDGTGIVCSVGATDEQVPPELAVASRAGPRRIGRINPSAVHAHELAALLAAHQRWREGEPDGSKLDLAGRYLRGVSLSHALLKLAVFRGADISDAWLVGADLEKANLISADLHSSDLSCA